MSVIDMGKNLDSGSVLPQLTRPCLCTSIRHRQDEMGDLANRLARNMFTAVHGRKPVSSEDYTCIAKAIITVQEELCDFLEANRRA